MTVSMAFLDSAGRGRKDGKPLTKGIQKRSVRHFVAPGRISQQHEQIKRQVLDRSTERRSVGSPVHGIANENFGNFVLNIFGNSPAIQRSNTPQSRARIPNPVGKNDDGTWHSA